MTNLVRSTGNYLKVTENSKFYYNFLGITFYFSRSFIFNKFKKELNSYIQEENAKIENKYQVDCDLSLFLAISFYCKLEKRGFTIKYKDEIIKEKPIIFSKI